MTKVDAEAVRKMLEAALAPRRLYSGAMPTCTLAGVSYDYLTPAIEGSPEEVQSWAYGQWPKVEAAVPLTDGGTVLVYGEASRRGHGHIIVSWLDDEEVTHWAWIPAANVRRLTPSEADIIDYNRCPPHRRAIRWRDRFPGILPE